MTSAKAGTPTKLTEEIRDTHKIDLPQQHQGHPPLRKPDMHLARWGLAAGNTKDTHR